MDHLFNRVRPPTSGKGREKRRQALDIEQLQTVGIVSFEENNDRVTGRYSSYDRCASEDSSRALSLSSDSGDRAVRKEQTFDAGAERVFSWPKWFGSSSSHTTARDRSNRERLSWPVKGRERRSHSIASTASYSSCECEHVSEADGTGQSTEAGNADTEGSCCDPITLAPFEETTYEYITPCGRTIKYSLRSLVEYIHKTGETMDPVSRTQYSDNDLRNMDKIAAHSVLPEIRGLPSVLAVKDNREQYEKQRQAGSTVLGLEACLGEMIVEVLSEVEGLLPRKNSGPTLNSYYYNKAEMRILCLFNNFDIPFNELKRLSIERAYQAYKGWGVFLRGPAKHPTQDTLGALTMALRALDTHWSDEDQGELEEFRRSNANARLSATCL